MPYDLTRPLVIGISSRALFDLEEENRIFENEGLNAYIKYQVDNEDKVLQPGAGFELIKAFLRLNDLNKDNRLVEVIIMSRNSPDTSLRIFNSIEKYGLDKERYLNALAKISCINYANSKRNPLAQTRKWFMSYEEATSRGSESNPIVGGLLGVSDCSQVTDGAAVVVLCSEKYLKEKGLRDKAVVKGYGHRTAPLLFDKKMSDNANSEYVLPWTRRACLDAYRRAGLTVEDIDVFETHDCFTSSEYAAISAFGITEPGKEWDAVENGTIDFGGAKPINPSGGLIGCGHPVGASGVRMFIDLYKQVTGKAGRYQVANTKNGIMLNIGGSATTNYVFIVGRE